jgi:hypothetical protein
VSSAPCTYCVRLRTELAAVKAERDAATGLLSKVQHVAELMAEGCVEG